MDSLTATKIIKKSDIWSIWITSSDLTLIPSLKGKGFPVRRSCNEQYKLFTLFENNLRHFIRPNNTLENLEGFTPTALLLDCEKTCLVEVFDQPESNTFYHKLKNRKMLYYKEQSVYQTYYWHSYRTKKMPTIP